MSHPLNEACLLSAFVEHAQRWLQDHAGTDPAVVVKTNGQWWPVRAGIRHTGEHRNAVGIDYLMYVDGKWVSPFDVPQYSVRQVYYRILETTGPPGANKQVWREPRFNTADEATLAFADAKLYPLESKFTIVRVTEEELLP